MSEPQLERSVLEAKEREELFAIADALGTRPTTRARKGDLVTAILRATGVEVSDEPEPPKRTRARKAAAKPVAAATEAADASTTPVTKDAATPAVVEAPAADVVADPPPAEQPAAVPALSDEPVTAVTAPPVETSPATVDVDAAPAEQPAGTVDVEAAPAEPPAAGTEAPRLPLVTGPTRNVVRATSRPAPAPSTTNGHTSPPADPPPRLPLFPRRPTPGALGGPPSGVTRPGGPSGPSAPRPPRPAPSDGRRPPLGGQPDAARTPPRPPMPSGAPIPASTQPSPPPPVRAGNGDGTDTAAEGGDGEQRTRFEEGTGNRRNRRRRGRDRGERSAERDLPTQSPEAPFAGEPVAVQGYLDLREEGYGFLRTQGYLASQNDVYVSISQVRRFSLRKGDWVEGAARPAAATEKYPALLRIDTVSGTSPEDARSRVSFDELTPVMPDQLIALARDDDPTALTVRLIDLLSPLGRGQRALVAGPPRSGKSALLVDVLRSIEANHPDLEVVVLVVDERPEEVTELRRAVRSEVIATTFDRPAEEHIQVAELVIERAKRQVEAGHDVVVVADGLTRLARAYNLVPSGSGRVLPGGIDGGALHHPLELFAAGRKIEGGGSLTVLATALVETGSRLDEVIHEELAAAANMQVRLDRALARRHVEPALDVEATWTRHEDRLLDADTLSRLWALRRAFDAPDGFEALLERVGATKSNHELLAEVSGALTSQGNN
jgi:transcription termination factor Rho